MPSAEPKAGPPRRRRRERYDVANMPAPWRRSLTESGMSRRTTRADVVIIIVFVIAFVALAAFLVTQTG
jgi:hypothetical protein